ncbi:MAG: response regulator [Proteobacteria bacterium]|nr:response regulator [Pseudomonadota bacterium]
MSNPRSNKRPFAIRLIGFDAAETARLEIGLAVRRAGCWAYIALHEDNLRDPDLFIANGTDMKALAKISYHCAGDIRPALLLGTPLVSLPYSSLPTPYQWPQLLAELDKLMDKRIDALKRLKAAGVVAIAERRRRERLDIDLTEPAEYDAMRRKPAEGGVLVVDKAAVLRDHLAGVMMRHKLTVGLAVDAAAAADYCSRFRVAAVLVNTSTPGVDAYALCRTIRDLNPKRPFAMILLAGKSFHYDAARARAAGCDGFLGKPLAPRHLLEALKKFLPLH